MVFELFLEVQAKDDATGLHRTEGCIAIGSVVFPRYLEAGATLQLVNVRVLSFKPVDNGHDSVMTDHGVILNARGAG